MAGARLVTREAIIATASGSTSAVPPIAAVLLVVGTVIREHRGSVLQLTFL